MSTDEASEDTDAYAAVRVGVHNRRLILEGWFASSADSGVPGPHIALRTSDGQRAVISTREVGEVVTALRTVAERIDALWEREGASYSEQVLQHSGDTDDPAAIAARRAAESDFYDRVSAGEVDVFAICAAAANPFDAASAVAAALGIDEGAVLGYLEAFSLSRLTGRAQDDGSPG